MLMEVSHISPCFAYRFKRIDESDVEYGRRAADELEAEIQRVGPDKVAAFVAEPVVGATLGCVPAVAGYFKRIREICDRHGILFIADEVMCGMGRTGTLYACEGDEVAPDLITCGKGLGAGYQPIAATLAAQRVIEAIEQGSGLLANGHTYMSHPVACACGVAVLDVIEGEDLLANVRRRGAELAAALEARFAQHPNVGDIRGRGLFQAIELVQDRETKAPFPRALNLAGRIKATAQANGLICYPSQGTADGENGDHVLLAPAYTVDSSHIEDIVDKLEKALKACLPAG
jgi:adenosylmethionine-8-amino-7-oxononanoate aminotransferase